MGYRDALPPYRAGCGWKAGQTIWVPARRHAGENLGDKAVEFIAIVPRR